MVPSITCPQCQQLLIDRSSGIGSRVCSVPRVGQNPPPRFGLTAKNGAVHDAWHIRTQGLVAAAVNRPTCTLEFWGHGMYLPSFMATYTCFGLLDPCVIGLEQGEGGEAVGATDNVWN